MRPRISTQAEDAKVFRSRLRSRKPAVPTAAAGRRAKSSAGKDSADGGGAGRRASSAGRRRKESGGGAEALEPADPMDGKDLGEDEAGHHYYRGPSSMD